MKDRIERTPRKGPGQRQNQRAKTVLPLLPVRGVVVFPYMVLSLPIGREASVRAVECALDADRRLLLVAQHQATVEEPNVDDLYQVGTVAPWWFQRWILWRRDKDLPPLYEMDRSIDFRITEGGGGNFDM